MADLATRWIRDGRQSSIGLSAAIRHRDKCLCGGGGLFEQSGSDKQHHRTDAVLGDALAVALAEMREFGSEDFARFHPGGTLGKKLYLRVRKLYIHNEKPQVAVATLLRDVIMEITSKRLGATAVTDGSGKLLGVITDGDLRRMLERSGMNEVTGPVTS